METTWIYTDYALPLVCKLINDNCKLLRLDEAWVGVINVRTKR